MTELFKIIGVAVVTMVAIMVIKPLKPEIAMIIGIAGSVLIFFFIVNMLDSVFGLFEFLMEKTNLDSDLFKTLIKIVGIGYISEFSANLCADSGNTALQGKVLLAGKLTIFILAIPIITSLIELIVSIMPWK